MEIERLRNFIEISKTVNNLNPNYMKIIFIPKLHPKIRLNDIRVKSLKILGTKMWNQLPGDIKSETSYTNFKECIDTWFEPKCRCNVCMNVWNSISVKCLLTLVNRIKTKWIRNVIIKIILSKSFGESSIDFYSILANVTKTIQIKMYPLNSSSIICVSSYSILLNKNPGLRPTGVSENLRRIIGKVVVSALKAELLHQSDLYKHVQAMKLNARQLFLP